jgi:hypothetical protein
LIVLDLHIKGEGKEDEDKRSGGSIRGSVEALPKDRPIIPPISMSLLTVKKKLWKKDEPLLFTYMFWNDRKN